MNPSSILLSAVMMLEYMGWTEAAAMITAAMERAFESGRATSDLARFMERGTPLGTVEFGPGSDRQFITFCKKSQSFVYCAVAKLK